MKFDTIKEIIRLAIPSTLAQLINMIYSIVDRIFIGHIPDIGSDALSGIGSCFPIFIFISAFSQLWGVGGSTAISIELGNGNNKNAEKIMGNVFNIMILECIVLYICFQIFKTPLLLYFGASKSTIVYANQYLDIYLLGIVFQSFVTIYSYFLICQGYAKISMYICMISALMNVGLDYILVYICDCGIHGASIATVLSQMLGATILLLVINKGKHVKNLQIRKENLHLDKRIIKSIFLYGVAAFTMTFTETCIHAMYNKMLQKYGSDIYIASMSIIQSLMQFVYVFSNGISQAIQPNISYYYGAQNSIKVREVCKIGIIVHLFIAFCGSGILIIFRDSLALLFTNDFTVKNGVVMMLPIYLSGWGIFGIQSGVQCAFVGIGRTKSSLFLACFRKLVLLIPFMLIFPLFWGVTGIFLAEGISDGIAGIVAGILFMKRKSYFEIKSLNKRGTV